MRISFRPHDEDTRFVEATVHNDTPIVQSVLYWGTVLDELSPSLVKVFDEEGYEVAYRGPRAKRLLDPKNSYVQILPGEQKTTLIDIAGLFDLPASARYKIVWQENLFQAPAPEDFEAQETMGPTIMHPAAEIELGLKPVEQPYTFRPEPTEEPGSEEDFTFSPAPRCPPLILCAAPSYNDGGTCIRNRYISTPRVNGSSSAHAQTIKTATLEMYKAILLHRINDTPAFRRWFGAYSTVKAAAVSKVFNGYRGQQRCKSFAFYTNLGGCTNPDTIAWFSRSTDPSRLSAGNFCPAFFRMPQSGFDSRMGTIAHELSHGYGGTVDHVYGMANCESLARFAPHKAIENADNYQFYVEQVASESLAEIQSWEEDEHVG